MIACLLKTETSKIRGLLLDTESHKTCGDWFLQAKTLRLSFGIRSLVSLQVEKTIPLLLFSCFGAGKPFQPVEKKFLKKQD